MRNIANSLVPGHATDLIDTSDTPVSTPVRGRPTIILDRPPASSGTEPPVLVSPTLWDEEPTITAITAITASTRLDSPELAASGDLKMNRNRILPLSNKSTSAPAGRRGGKASSRR